MRVVDLMHPFWEGMPVFPGLAWPSRPTSSCGAAPRLDVREQLDRAEELELVEDAQAELLRAASLFVGGRAGVEDDVRLRTQEPDRLRGVEPAQDRHLDVEQRDVRPVLQRGSYRVAAVRR